MTRGRVVHMWLGDRWPRPGLDMWYGVGVLALVNIHYLLKESKRDRKCGKNKICAGAGGCYNFTLVCCVPCVVFMYFLAVSCFWAIMGDLCDRFHIWDVSWVFRYL